MKLITGLGNPGREYERTRHNAGFMVVDRLAPVFNMPSEKKMFRALVRCGQIDGGTVVLAKPQTYMNLSGESVRALMQWYKMSPGDLLVICDDLDLPPGKLRLRSSGGSGGHKGMESIIEALGTDGFPRLRVGIGRPHEPDGGTVGYVLGQFGPEETAVFEEALDLAAEAVVCALREGLERAMNRYNR